MMGLIAKSCQLKPVDPYPCAALVNSESEAHISSPLALVN